MAKGHSNVSPEEEKDPLARLIRSAGRRPPIAPGREQRVHKAVKDEWLRVVRARRIRRAVIFIPSGLVAAGVLFAVVSHYIKTSVGKPATVGSVEFVDGTLNESRTESLRLAKLGDPITTGSTLETTATSHASLRLSDGQSVRLDSGTRLRILAGSLYLESGAVYVDTARPQAGAGKAKEPVNIQTDFAEIHDVGTQFEVRLIDGARPLSIRVREGRVDFKRGTDKASVGAGEELSAAATGQFVERKISLSDPLWDWASSCAPAFRLEGSSLDAAVTWICREQGLQLVYDTETSKAAAKKIVLHGSLDGISPRKALDAVLPASGLSYSLDGGTLHLK